MQAKLKAIIIDDEPMAIIGLETALLNIDNIQVIKTFDSPEEAIDLINKKMVDLMFLDIEMPTISGIDFLKTLKEKPLTIITSAYPKYAIDGYELDVLDYLIKPIENERLVKSIQKAKEYLELKKAAIKDQNFIFIKCEKIIEKIILDDLIYLEGLGNYAAIYTTTKKYISHSTLASIHSLLPADRFIKVQKSFIVSISKITSFDNKRVILKNKIIPISRHIKNEVHSEILGSKYLTLSK